MSDKVKFILKPAHREIVQGIQTAAYMMSFTGQLPYIAFACTASLYRAGGALIKKEYHNAAQYISSPFIFALCLTQIANPIMACATFLACTSAISVLKLNFQNLSKNGFDAKHFLRLNTTLLIFTMMSPVTVLAFAHTPSFLLMTTALYLADAIRSVVSPVVSVKSDLTRTCASAAIFLGVLQAGLNPLLSSAVFFGANPLLAGICNRVVSSMEENTFYQRYLSQPKSV